MLLQLCLWSCNLHSLLTWLDMRERDTLNKSEDALRVYSLGVLYSCIALSFLTSMLKALNISFYIHGSFYWIFNVYSWMCSNEGQVWNSCALWVVSVAFSPCSAFAFCFCNSTSFHSTEAPPAFLLCVFFWSWAVISLPSCVANSISSAAVEGRHYRMMHPVHLLFALTICLGHVGKWGKIKE